MKWWKSRRGNNPEVKPADHAHIPAVEMPGWEMVEQNAQMTVWRDSAGDVVSLAKIDAHEIIQNLSDKDAVRRYCRKMAEGENSGLVEADVVEGAYGRSLMFVIKRLDKPAFVYTGRLLVPMTNSALLWTMVAFERGTTGVREAIVAGQLFKEGKLTIESYKASWAQDPYDPAYVGVDRSTLRYHSDAETYDPLFPQHPLSKVRKELHRLLTVKVEA